jgi:cation diffusion facilitator family transporter
MDPPRLDRKDAAANSAEGRQRLASRVAWASIGVSLTVSVVNLAVAVASGSLAVTAEMVHCLVDLAGSSAVLLGVRISQRKSRSFPFGLYKVENVVAVVLAVLIFLTGFEIARDAILVHAGRPRVSAPILAGVAFSALLPFVFSIGQMRVGRSVNSPSLIAAAREYRTHVLTSGVVFLALAGQLAGVHLERYAALVIVVFIARTGWELLSGGMRVLLDASLDADTLNRVRAIIDADPSVSEIRSLAGRNAGRYRFLEAEVALRVRDLVQAHRVSERLERAIRARVPHVERVLLHYEPQAPARLRYATPLADVGGIISEHFGEAPYFGLLTVSQKDGLVERQEVLANPYRDADKAKGIRTGEWLAGLKTDVLLLRHPERISGKGATYVFADAGIEVRQTRAATLADAVTEVTSGPARPPAPASGPAPGNDGTG